MNTEYNKVTPTTRTKRMNTPSKKRVDFRFGDRQTEEQEVEENAKVLEDRVVDISATPIRETAPAPSGMHVNEKEDNDDDIEAEVFVDAQEENEDQNEFKLPLREIFRAKHLFDPRDGHSWRLFRTCVAGREFRRVLTKNIVIDTTISAARSARFETRRKFPCGK